MSDLNCEKLCHHGASLTDPLRYPIGDGVVGRDLTMFVDIQKRASTVSKALDPPGLR